MNDDLLTKLDQLLPPKNQTKKVSDKYFYYCYGYLTALDSHKIISKDEYVLARIYVSTRKMMNDELEE